MTGVGDARIEVTLNLRLADVATRGFTSATDGCLLHEDGTVLDEVGRRIGTWRMLP